MLRIAGRAQRTRATGHGASGHGGHLHKVSRLAFEDIANRHTAENIRKCRKHDDDPLLTVTALAGLSLQFPAFPNVSQIHVRRVRRVIFQSRNAQTGHSSHLTRPRPELAPNRERHTAPPSRRRNRGSAPLQRTHNGTRRIEHRMWHVATRVAQVQRAKPLEPRLLCWPSPPLVGARPRPHAAFRPASPSSLRRPSPPRAHTPPTPRTAGAVSRE